MTDGHGRGENGRMAKWVSVGSGGAKQAVWLLAAWLLYCAVAGCSKKDDATQRIVPPAVDSIESALAAENWPIDALTATNSIEVKDRAAFIGDMSVVNAAFGPSLAEGLELAVGSDATLDGSLRANRIRLNVRSTIIGNASYNNLVGSGTVVGNHVSPLALPLPVTIPALPVVNPGTQAVTVGNSQSATLAEGAYGAVTVQSGNGSVTTRLTLTGGVYHFTSLTLGNDANVECAAECEVRIQSRVAIQDRAYVGPSAQAPIGPGNVQLLVHGSNGSAHPWGWPLAMTLGNDSDVAAYALVPNGTVAIGDRVELAGKLVARDISVGFDMDGEGLQLPVITQQPLATTVSSGANATFSVVADGQDLTYEWLRDGVDIPGATGVSFTLSGVSATDDGAVFSVRVSNAAGVVLSDAAILTVESCSTSDATCDGVDDDCDGTVDEDFVPSCEGSAQVVCTDGAPVQIACDDGDACNGDESCNLGTCQAGVPPTVDDENPCTTDACDPETGVTHVPVASGTSCADGDLCNGDETCDSDGTCQADTPLDPDDGNVCTTDSCDPATGAVNDPIAAGSSCADGNVCNGAELCDGSGACQPGVPLDPNDGNVCTADSCDPVLGIVNAPVAAGTSCADANVCNGAETCNGAGACQPGTPLDPDDGNVCTADSCDPATGVVNTPVAAGTSCADGDICNGDEVCDGSGGCQVGTALDPDDGNPCTDDSCDAELGILNIELVAGTSCADGDLCNGDELCDGAGTCQAGTPLDPDDGNVCTTDSCDAATGVLNEPVTAGTSCADGDLCNGDEACDAAGACQAGSPLEVDDDNPCTTDSCDPATGVVNEPVTIGTSCADGDLCNGNETCDGSGSCQAGTALDPDDDNPCTTDSCDPIAGVVNEPVSAGNSCADNNLCNGDELCDATGVCQAGTALDPDDGNACTSDSCHPATGIVNEPVAMGTSCADGDLCNGDELCDDAGTCEAGSPLDPDDGNPCTDDSCDPELGVLNVDLVAGTACADDDLCNGDELCDGAGTCEAGSPLDPDDGNVCTSDSCDPLLGVTNDPVTAGTSCADTTVCNGDELCDAAGTCQPGAPPNVDDGNPCTIDSCDPTTGVSNELAPAGSSCADDDLCNGDELCDGAGLCETGTPPDPDDGNPCTVDSCDPSLGVSNDPAAAGTGCADGDLCNGDELCDGAGACVVGDPVNPDDSNPCTTDSCDPTLGVLNEPVAEGTSCSDGDVCNGVEECTLDGDCLGDPLEIPPSTACTIYSCDPVDGIVMTTAAPGDPCQLDACTTGTCSTVAECIPTEPPPDDGDPCTIERCNDTTGTIEIVECPPLDPSVTTTVFDATEWLFTGPSPVQEGVAPGRIDFKRASLIRGTIRNRNGDPLPSVVVTAVRHPELGSTKTMTDGSFQFVVNGGGALLLDFQKPGFLSSGRRVEPLWNGTLEVDDVFLVPSDPVVTPVDVGGATTSYQVAMGSAVSDADPTRQGILLLPPNVAATMHLDGEDVPLTEMNVRITEFTVGSEGPRAMPADLPYNTGYTYAIEVNADEAVAAGASEITFSEPLVYYVENFLGFPAGTAVPVGSYNREEGHWIPHQNGIVLDILAVIGGAAVVDTTGDGEADTPQELDDAGIDEEELLTLGGLHPAGTSLWRVRLPHFTQPYDFNWPIDFPEDAEDPPPDDPDTDDDDPTDCTQTSASTVECRNQTYLETIPVAGTEVSLNYSSARVPGRVGYGTARIALTDGAPPPSIVSASVRVEVAGREFRLDYADVEPNQSALFTWDGLDAYGRRPYGRQWANIIVSYEFEGVYVFPPGDDRLRRAFGLTGETGEIGRPTRERLYKWRKFRLPIGGVSAAYAGLGGWTLSPHHYYSAATNQLILGDGSESDGRALEPTLHHVAGTHGQEGIRGDDGNALNAFLDNGGPVAVGSDGSVYFAEPRAIRRVRPDGVIERFAGDYQSGSAGEGDGGPALDARFGGSILEIAIGADDSLYISTNQCRIRRVDPAGIIDTIAGTGCGSYNGVPGEAIAARFSAGGGLAVAPDGSLYVSGSNRIHRIDTGGWIERVAGTGGGEQSSDPIETGDPALEAAVQPGDLAFDPQGNLHFVHDGFLESGSRVSRIYRLEGDGSLTRVAGCNQLGCPEDLVSGTALEVKLSMVDDSLTFGPDGRLYFQKRVSSTGSLNRVITLDANGSLRPLFNGTASTREGETANSVALHTAGLAFGPEGLIVSQRRRIYRIQPAIPSLAPGDTIVSSADGMELYHFDSTGTHLATLDARTQATLWTFEYDSGRRLIRLTDEVGKVTEIVRDSQGVATAIVGPFGQQTQLTLNGDGYLIEASNQELTYGASYQDEMGLISNFTNPKQGTSVLTYDPLGRLTNDRDPAGADLSLERVELDGGWSITKTSDLGRQTNYLVETFEDGSRLLTNTFPNQTFATEQRLNDESRVQVLPDGTEVTTTRHADPRWGGAAPFFSSTTRLPSGLTRDVVRLRFAAYVDADPTDPTAIVGLRDATITNGRRADVIYTADDRTFTTRTAAGRDSQRVTDEFGRTVSVAQVFPDTSNPVFLPVTFTYDADGRLQTTSQGDRVTTYGYFDSGDSAGMLQSIVDPASRTTTMVRDGIGRVLSETFSGTTTSFTWDGNSNLESVTPPGKPTHTMQYTPVNLMESYTPPDPETGVSLPPTTYAYDGDRALDLVTRPDALNTDYQYDTQTGQLTTVIAPGGTITHTYYDASDVQPGAAPGRLETLAGPYTTSLTYTYDGRLTTSEALQGDVAGTLSWAYNNDFVVSGQTTEPATGGGTTSYSYDDDLLMTCASRTACVDPDPSQCVSANPCSEPDALVLTRDPNHGLVTALNQGAVVESWAYSAYGELASQSSSFSGTPLLSIVYDEPSAERDDLGRIVQKTETRAAATPSVTEYEYDLLGRLERVTIDGVLSEQYNYDTNGNRVVGFTPALGTVAGTYDSQDRLLAYGDWEYTYTANGELSAKFNTATDEMWEYTYDVFGNLLSVTLPNDTLIEYVTDGRHRRVGKKVDGVMVRQWLYEDQLNPVAELDGSGNLLYHYVYASREHTPDFVVNAADDVYRVISDQLGSPRLVVNVEDDTDVLLEATYSAFGERTVITGDPDGLTVGFAGGLFDSDTGLTRFGARDYDPQVGRWTSKDPVRFDAGTNHYAYANGDPVNATDPTGTQAAPPLVVPGLGPGAAVGAGGILGALLCYLIPECRAAVSDAIDDFADMCRDASRGDPVPDEMSDDCRAEWKAARDLCGQLLTGKRTRTNRRMTGPRRTVEDCARGFVSQRCGGNSVN